MFKVLNVEKVKPTGTSKVIGYVTFETDEMNFKVKIINTVKGYLVGYPSYNVNDKWIEYFQPKTENARKEVEQLALAAFKSQQESSEETAVTTKDVPW